jgi:hypothetical protein
MGRINEWKDRKRERTRKKKDIKNAREKTTERVSE